MFLGGYPGLTKLLSWLLRPVLAGGFGILAFSLILFLFAVSSQQVQAAPPIRPQVEILTDTTRITHTALTTHQMSVFADGRLSDWFMTADSSTSTRNQIDQDGQDPNGTTIAILFTQHAITDVDVGVLADFTPTKPITLNTVSTIPGYNEDTHTIYASQVLSYQVTQRTLATYAENCVVMELDIRNTGSIPLTGGRLLYMLDIDVAHHSTGDLGFYDAARRLVYLTDQNTGSDLGGFAMGISLLRGAWAGYAVNGVNTFTPGSPYPTQKAHIRAQMLSPFNAVTNGDNDVLWIVAGMPDLSPGQTTPLAFALCAKNGTTEAEAGNNLGEIFNNVARLSAVKTATPAPGSIVVAGKPMTYSIAITNTGLRPVYDLVITDTVPTFTDLLAYSVSRGSITVNNGVVRADIDQLEPADDPVIMTLVVRPWLTATHGASITNRAFVRSEPIVMATNLITHQVFNNPILAITKTAAPASVVEPGQVLTYSIVVANSGPAPATGVIISDPVPANTQFITDSIHLDPLAAGNQGTTPPILVDNLTVSPGQSATVTFAVRVNSPLSSSTVITNRASVTADQQPAPLAATVTHTVQATPVVAISKTGPASARVGETIIFTYTVSNAGNTLLQIQNVEDDIAGPAVLVEGDVNGDNWLDLTENWVYTASYTIPPAAPALLTNTVTVTAVDAVNVTTIATATFTTNINFAPVLTMAKTGPLTAIVGQTVIFTFTVGHGSGSDGSPIRNIVVSDNYAGAATRISGDINGNNWLDAAEVWAYAVSYTIQASNPNPLVNTGTVRGRDSDNQLVTATASHTTTLSGFAPVLYVDKDGPAAARIGQTVVFTFNVINLTEPAIKKFGLDIVAIAAVLGDGSTISDISVSDDVAGPGSYVSGDFNGNNKLDGGERWGYTASYTILDTDPDPLINTVTVTGLDQEGDGLTGYDSFSTSIIHTAALNLRKIAPVIATAGETTVFTFAVSHTADSDGSPVHDLAVSDSLAGSAYYIGGDINGNLLLDANETWVYAADYRVPRDVSGLILSVGTVLARDRDNKLITAGSTYSTLILANPWVQLYFPLIFRATKP